MPDFHVAFRNHLHAVNLRHGTDGFTSPPKEGVLRIFSPWKIPTALAGFEPANLGTKGQHATSRPPKPLLASLLDGGLWTSTSRCYFSAWKEPPRYAFSRHIHNSHRNPVIIATELSKLRKGQGIGGKMTKSPLLLQSMQWIQSPRGNIHKESRFHVSGQHSVQTGEVRLEGSQAEERRSPIAKACFCGVMTHFNEKKARGLDLLRKLGCSVTTSLQVKLVLERKNNKEGRRQIRFNWKWDERREF